ncbi:hypothetical protein HPP92_028089 [Vanilla planifolia]|uniref:Uncharacterized protein n=1 Tax=Vanilla planifolia TaxID=51239 RepID=A0A835P9H7_VANPL|nr:hypothetical protein HPP92_028089 [Vanilla planifolia]KAG0447991.1 hypothetical protein HPP92_028066 [Vanilla planifolia]
MCWHVEEEFIAFLKTQFAFFPFCEASRSSEMKFLFQLPCCSLLLLHEDQAEQAKAKANGEGRKKNDEIEVSIKCPVKRPELLSSMFLFQSINTVQSSVFVFSGQSVPQSSKIKLASEISQLKNLLNII